MKTDAKSPGRRAERVINEAKNRGTTIVTAESCTAGALAQLLANTPGAGDVFHGAFVVYSKDQKTTALGVPAALIAEHSAVSAAVATAMAEAALSRSPADLAVSVTGVLGPEPDEDGNPVGLVYLAMAKRNGFVQSYEGRFGDGPQDEICAAILDKALILLDEGLTTGDR